jgi:hypothetical protein
VISSELPFSVQERHVSETSAMMQTSVLIIFNPLEWFTHYQLLTPLFDGDKLPVYANLMRTFSLNFHTRARHASYSRIQFGWHSVLRVAMYKAQF